MFLSEKEDRRFVCRSCLNSYTNQTELTTHKRLCGNNDKSVYLPCKGTHVKWDKYYQKSPYIQQLLQFTKMKTNLFLLKMTIKEKQ